MVARAIWGTGAKMSQVLGLSEVFMKGASAVSEGSTPLRVAVIIFLHVFSLDPAGVIHPPGWWLLNSVLGGGLAEQRNNGL